jgi:DNA-binding transcriptional ArsR family regulator
MSMARAKGSVAPPDASRRIADVETLRALSDPLRLRILEAMVGRVDAPWTVKELAAALAVPQTRLYHHLDLLVERDLVRVVGQRIVSGIIERRYQVAALSFELDRELVGGGAAGESANRELLASVFDRTRSELEEVLAGRVEEGTAVPAVLARTLARIPRARAEEFRARLAALRDEFAADDAAPDAEPYALVVALYRVPDGGAAR